jgi:hypothetical protein
MKMHLQSVCVCVSVSVCVCVHAYAPVAVLSIFQKNMPSFILTFEHRCSGPSPAFFRSDSGRCTSHRAFA